MSVDYQLTFPPLDGAVVSMTDGDRLNLANGLVSSRIGNANAFLETFSSALSQQILTIPSYEVPRVGFALQGLLNADSVTPPGPDPTVPFSSLKVTLTENAKDFEFINENQVNVTLVLENFIQGLPNSIRSSADGVAYQSRVEALTSLAVQPLNNLTNQLLELFSRLRSLSSPYPPSTFPPTDITSFQNSILTQVPGIYAALLAELVPTTGDSLFTVWRRLINNVYVGGGQFPTWVTSLYLNGIFGHYMYWNGILLLASYLIIEAFHITNATFSPSQAQGVLQNPSTGYFNVLTAIQRSIPELVSYQILDLGPETSTIIGPANKKRIFMVGPLRQGLLYNYREVAQVLMFLQTGLFRGWRLPQFINGQVEMYQGTNPEDSPAQQFATLKSAGFLFPNYQVQSNTLDGQLTYPASFCWAQFEDNTVGPAPLDGSKIYTVANAQPDRLAYRGNPNYINTAAVMQTLPTQRYQLYLCQAWPPTAVV